MTLDQSPSIYPEDYCYTDEALELREMRQRFYADEDYDDEIDEYCSVRRLVPPPLIR